MKRMGKTQVSLGVSLLALFALAFSKLVVAAPPLLNIESPAQNSVVSGVITIFGWSVGSPEVRQAWFSLGGGPFTPLPYGGYARM